MPTAPAFWFQPHPTLLAKLLTPLSHLVTAVSTAQRWWRAKRPYYPTVPTISLGNLTVGGGGKTPLAEYLARHFASQGHQVAIISRGYGGHETAQPLQVRPHQHTAWHVGDEPLALARSLASLPVTVWVGRTLPATVQRAEQAGATLLILDDAFHRTDVARTVDVLVVHGANPWGNGCVLPAGPLREPLSHRHRAHLAVIINPSPGTPPGHFYGLPAYRLTSQPTPHSMAPLKGQRLIAFAGLAHPEKFFHTLTSHAQAGGYEVLATHPFPDHHAYTSADRHALTAEAQARRAILVTTSKDAAKLPPTFAHVLQLTFTGPELPNLLTDLALRLNSLKSRK
jgi:tetraacyldisaccharide 4'-kinase